MKKLLTIIFLFFGLAAFTQPNLNNLKFDSDKYYYRRTPGNPQSSFNFNVQIRVPQSIDLITSDNGNSVRKFKTNGNGNYGTGKPLTALAVPLLFEVSPATDGVSTLFKFGQSAAEDDFNSAEVFVGALGNQVSTSTITNLVRPPVDVEISNTEFFSYPATTQRSNQNYLWIDANRSNPITIAIRTESRRGQVYVCIFNRN